MASTVKLNLNGFTRLRQSPEMTQAINTEARKLTDRANTIAAGECSDPSHARFEYSPAQPTDIGQVALASTGHDEDHYGTIRHNAKHNTLAKALGGG